MTKKQLNQEIKSIINEFAEIHIKHVILINMLNKLDRSLTDRKTRLSKKK